MDKLMNGPSGLPGEAIKVERREPGDVFFVKADKVSGYISKLALRYYTQAQKSEMYAHREKKRKAGPHDCKLRGGIDIGMTREQVYESCWGKPRSINGTITARGTHEQ